MNKNIIYLNNAATSWPKPEPVIEKMTWAMKELMAAPGRGSAGLQAERAIFEARESVADFIGAPDSSRVIFTANATAALNLAISGFVKAGDHIVTTSMDHNSVARPLSRVSDTLGVEITRLQGNSVGEIQVSDIMGAVRPATSLIILTHASNVTGTIQPVESVCQEISDMDGRRPLVLVDAAQTAGVVPIDVEKSRIDLLAVPGHKSLYGPQGTGFLYIRDGIDLDPLLEGGTGGNSILTRQPDVLPERFECGTPNTPGIVGLGEAVRYISSRGVNDIRSHEDALMMILMEGLAGIKGVSVQGPLDHLKTVSVLSFSMDGMDPSEVGTYLEEVNNIQVRVGLHCSPHSHRTIGTFPEGTVRVSPGIFNTPDDIRALLSGLERLSRHRRDVS